MANENDDVNQEMSRENHDDTSAPESNATSRFREQLAAKKKEELEDDSEESTLWSGGYSPKAMFGTWIVMLAVTIALMATPIFTELSGKAVALMVLAIWVIGGLMYGYRRLGYHYELTTQRFIHQAGILHRQTDRIEVIDIDDVSFTQGPIQRIFGVGKIQLTGSDRTHPNLSMIGIADVKKVSDLIDDIRRQERRRRSLHIESI